MLLALVKCLCNLGELGQKPSPNVPRAVVELCRVLLLTVKGGSATVYAHARIREST
jgi:hypothetical protein